MSKVLSDISRILKSAKTALIISHQSPDYDSIGSAIAMALMLRSMKIRTLTYCVDLPPKKYAFIPGVNDVRNSLPKGAFFDVAVTIDSADLKRVGDRIDVSSVARTVINIDHHPDNTRYGNINLVEMVSSAAELVYKVCKFLKLKITPDIAACLYVALLTDTGSFRYENTGSDTFRIAAELVQLGADPAWAAMNIYDTRSRSSFKILEKALSNLKTAQGGRIVWTALSKSDIDAAGASGEDFTGIIDFLRSYDRSEVALLFREEKKNVIKVNFRSKRYANVQKIASKFGGGGHIRASGATVEGNIKKVSSKVVSAVRMAVKDGRNTDSK